jgi:hypothetical protein
VVRRHLFIGWGVFVIGLLVIQLSGSEPFIGLLTALAGLYVSLAYGRRSLAAATGIRPGSPLVALALSAGVLALAVA